MFYVNIDLSVGSNKVLNSSEFLIGLYVSIVYHGFELVYLIIGKSIQKATKLIF